jgi:prepilin-type processing-associated H-X9-DG protein
MAIIGILASLLLPVLSRGQTRARLVWCGNNLAQCGLGFQSFAHDHDSHFPLQVPGSQGGVADSAPLTSGLDFSGASFGALGQELSDPRILVCPTDTRPAASSFARLQPGNVSYFANASADYNQPESVLAGDRNLTLTPGTTSASDGSGQSFAWNQAMHQGEGNLLYADGHVASSRSFALGPWANRQQLAQNHPAHPTAPVSPLTPQQAAAVSALLAQGIVDYPLAAFRPLITRRLSGIHAPDPLDGQSLPVSSGESFTPPPPAASPALVSAPLTSPAPVLTAEDDEPMQFFVHHPAHPVTNYVATGSWLLLALAALRLAWQVWRRQARAQK